MFKVVISRPAYLDLQRFIDNYEERFFDLYRDSGLHNLDLIRGLYRETSKKLMQEIIDRTMVLLKGKKVYGRRRQSAWQELSFQIGGRLVTVHFIDDVPTNIRWVTRIGIGRKPISF
jgi:hypothetical protein